MVENLGCLLTLVEVVTLAPYYFVIGDELVQILTVARGQQLAEIETVSSFQGFHHREECRVAIRHLKERKGSLVLLRRGRPHSRRGQL